MYSLTFKDKARFIKRGFMFVGETLRDFVVYRWENKQRWHYHYTFTPNGYKFVSRYQHQ